jgi:hypothetical protein
MADVNSQVALGINPPDPQGGLNTLSKILQVGQQGLGIKEQQQKVQQATIETERQQGLQNFFKNWDGHDGPDGTTDLDSVHNSSAYKNAGLAKPDIDLKLSQIKQAQLQNKQSLTTLNGANLQQFGQIAQSLHADQDVKDDTPLGRQKVTEALSQFSKLGPDAARVASIYAPVVQHAPQGKLESGVRAIAAQAQDVSAQQSQTNPQRVTNAAGVAFNRDNATGAITEQPGAPSGSKQNPATPQIAGQTTRQVATGNADVDRANQVSGLVQPSSAAIPLTQHIDDLADQIHSGKFVASISKAAAAVGMSEETYARQVLEKELGQVKTLAIANAGSDARAATIQSGYPDATSDTKTIHTAMDYTRGTFRQNVARGDLLNQVKSKDQSLQGFQHADDVLTSGTDPLMHEFKALKTPAERIEFYRRNFTDPTKAQDFRNKVAGMGHVFGQ